MANKKVAYSQLIQQVNGIVSLKGKSDEFVGLVKRYLKIIFDDSSTLYGFILHDKDMDQETGRIKTPHIHFVAKMKKRVRVSTLINRISKACDVETCAITIDRYQSFEGCFQYLIHQNNPEKFHYPVEDIVTNIPEDEIDFYLDATTSVIDFEAVVVACKEARDLLDVIATIGMSAYKSYRMVVIDIYQCVQARLREEKALGVEVPEI